jgi:hypothetical protein
MYAASLLRLLNLFVQLISRLELQYATEGSPQGGVISPCSRPAGFLVLAFITGRIKVGSISGTRWSG